MNSRIDKTAVMAKIEKFKELSYPNRNLTREILQMLGIYDIVDLEISLNKVQPRERMATMRMLEKYLEDLLSGDARRWNEAKAELRDIFFQIDEMDEEGYL